MSEGRIDMFFTESEEKSAREDFKKAEEAGVNLDKVKWIKNSEMKEVNVYYLLQFTCL